NIDDLVDVSKLTWKDPIASMVLSDDSAVVENLSKRQRRTFLEPREKMKCKLPDLVSLKCNESANNFHKISILDEFKDISHNGLWKEEESDLGKITERILSTPGNVWNNPAFETSMSPERQSLASKARRNDGIECSCVFCSATKKEEDDIKLWRELLDGSSYINSACRPIHNQFGVVGIQVAGERIYLNVLMNDTNEIPRYFHLDIPLTSDMSWRVEPLIRLLLTLRNIIIVNKSLLTQALEQAISHPPRNAHTSPTVSSPRREECREEPGQKRPRKNSKTRRLTKRKSAYF
ncbi:10310_t:CDS:2, partial [Dentiscutata heterogama]